VLVEPVGYSAPGGQADLQVSSCQHASMSPPANMFPIAWPPGPLSNLSNQNKTNGQLSGTPALIDLRILHQSWLTYA